MNEVEKIILKRINNQKTIFLHGGWGIGKTHFAKNVLYKEIEKRNDVVYMDARIFDQDSSAFDYVAYFAKKNKDRKAKFKEMGKKGAKVFLNGMIFGANSIAKTNIKYKELVNDIDLEIELSEARDKITIIIDELDRVTPDTVLKTLNFINGISIMNDDLQVIMVGNKEEIESILNKKFGFNEGREFTHKYFAEVISLNKITQEYVDEIAIEALGNLDFFNTFKIKSQPRDVKRAFIMYKNNKAKYGGVLSEGVFLAALHSELSNDRLRFWTNAMAVTGEGNHYLCEFTATLENGIHQISTAEQNSWGQEVISHMVELHDNYGLKNFNRWMDKHFSSKE